MDRFIFVTGQSELVLENIEHFVSCLSILIPRGLRTSERGRMFLHALLFKAAFSGLDAHACVCRVMVTGLGKGDALGRSWEHFTYFYCVGNT